MTITLAIAQELARNAFTEGEAQGITGMSVVVTDPGGHIRFAARSDAQGIFGVDTAVAKARSALGFGRSSLLLSKTFVDPCGVASLSGATHGAFLPLGGGVIVQRDGITIGAAAISGGMPDIDDAVIRTAVAAVGLSALP